MKRLGTVVMILGLLLIAGAVGLVLYNRYDSERAGAEAEAIRDGLANEIDGSEYDPYGGQAWERGDWDGAETGSVPDMPTKLIDGYYYIGILDVPSKNLSLPVMAEWDYTRLKISPCLYSGSYYTNDLVICGHNYARHFSPMRSADIGSDVYFTAVDGAVYHYIISNRETVRPTDVESMIDSEADWDMTLFTCNLGGQTRCAVRCLLVTEEAQP